MYNIKYIGIKSAAMLVQSGKYGFKHPDQSNIGQIYQTKGFIFPPECYDGNQVEWLFNYFNQISIKYFHVFHVLKVMFQQENVDFINNAVNLTLRSILIRMYIVNISPKMFQTSNQRCSDQIRRALKTKIFAPLEISRGPHLNICGTLKFPGGLALPTPWKFPGPGNIQGLEISRLC